MSHHELKELQTERSKLEAERDSLTRQINVCNTRIAEIEKRIRQLTAVPVVSEHALLRYLERKLGIDLEEVKKEILTDETAERIKQFGSGRFPIGDGMRAVVKQNVVVSVVN